MFFCWRRTCLLWPKPPNLSCAEGKHFSVGRSQIFFLLPEALAGDDHFSLCRSRTFFLEPEPNMFAWDGAKHFCLGWSGTLDAAPAPAWLQLKTNWRCTHFPHTFFMNLNSKNFISRTNILKSHSRIRLLATLFKVSNRRKLLIQIEYGPWQHCLKLLQCHPSVHCP